MNSPADLLDLITTAATQEPPLKKSIDNYVTLVGNLCRDIHTLQEARELVPISEIVQTNLDILDGNYKDKLLPHVVDWFGNRFFKWFKPPSCNGCEKELVCSRTSISVEGKSTEHYQCPGTSCQKTTFDFIRHNDPAILIRLRQGRCGEWANCFMVILTALDYDARLVLDTTDHVWNEVWSESQGRWLHVDPCEKTVDKPLLYELGWGKKLQYCIGFGQFEAIDVTRRYSSNYNETLTRRKSCPESWLTQYLDLVTHRLLDRLDTPLKAAQIMARRQEDDKYMATLASGPRTTEPDTVQARTTGDLTWRTARGE